MKCESLPHSSHFLIGAWNLFEIRSCIMVGIEDRLRHQLTYGKEETERTVIALFARHHQ